MVLAIALQISEPVKKALVNKAWDKNGKIPECFKCLICLSLVFMPL